MFLGLRGIGAIQGGIETHVTKLIDHLPDTAGALVVLGRAPYRPAAGDARAARALTVWLPTLRTAWAETMLHSLIGTIYAAFARPRILHIHGIGPGLMVPVARMFGLTVVITHHGRDYRREKWGTFARTVLQIGERLAIRSAHGAISVSPVDAAELSRAYGTPVRFIPNGVSPAVPVAPGAGLASRGLLPGRYIVNVARIVPEKRQIDLIDAFERADLPEDVRLVLIGGADHKSAYHEDVSARAAANPRVVTTGFQSGDDLVELFCNAGLFVLPSSHEGLPVSLLEAMEFGMPVLVSDLPIYGAMGLPEACRFPLGDVAALAERMTQHFAGNAGAADWSEFLSAYRWDHVAGQTAEVYLATGGLDHS